MQYLNIPTAFLRSPEYIAAEPTARATWLSLIGYCAEQENGGIIAACAAWKDRQWQQTAGVTLEETKMICSLWEWQGDSIILFGYPSDKEAMVRSKRQAGTQGGRAKTQAKTQAARQNGAKHNPSTTQATTQGNRKERKRKERKTEASVPAASSTGQADLPDFPPTATPPPKPKSERDAIKDALAGCGGADPSQIVPSAWSGIGKALADIMAVCPQVTPDEIATRSANYRTHMSADTILTPHALAKNWALCEKPNPRNQPTQESEFADAFDPDFQPHFHRTTTQ
jgi:hypothetical protein